MKVNDYNKKTKREYRKFMNDEKKAFNDGKRDSKHAMCEGNLW